MEVAGAQRFSGGAKKPTKERSSLVMRKPFHSFAAPA
jgi:hypothetical protein